MWIHSVFTYLYVSVRISRELTRTSSCYYLVFISLILMMELVAVWCPWPSRTPPIWADSGPAAVHHSSGPPATHPRDPLGRWGALGPRPEVLGQRCAGVCATADTVACRRLNLRYYSTCALYICTLYPTPGYVSGSVFERIWSRGWIRCVSYLSVRIPSVFNMQGNSIRPAPRGMKGHTERSLRCGVSELAELKPLCEISRS